MATTVIFIEHLITGLQASVWIILIVFTFLGYEWVNLSYLKGYELVVSFLALSIIYPLGIFIDDIADSLFKTISGKEKNKFSMVNVMSVTEINFYTDNQFIRNNLEYIRTRMRISRSTTINFSLITIMSIIFTFFTLETSNKVIIVLLEIILGLGITSLSYLTYLKLSNKFDKTKSNVSKLIKENFQKSF